jgi:hypothetical protein
LEWKKRRTREEESGVRFSISVRYRAHRKSADNSAHHAAQSGKGRGREKRDQVQTRIRVHITKGGNKEIIEPACDSPHDASEHNHKKRGRKRGQGGEEWCV